MKLDEDSIDPLTVARMTDHNVRGSDEGSEPEEKEVERSDAKIKVVTLESSEDTEANDEDQGGKLSPEEAIRIQSKDLPP